MLSSYPTITMVVPYDTQQLHRQHHRRHHHHHYRYHRRHHRHHLLFIASRFITKAYYFITSYHILYRDTCTFLEISRRTQKDCSIDFLSNALSYTDCDKA